MGSAWGTLRDDSALVFPLNWAAKKPARCSESAKLVRREDGWGDVAPERRSKGLKDEVQEGGEDGEYGELRVSVCERNDSSGVYLSWAENVEGVSVEAVTEVVDCGLEEIMFHIFDLHTQKPPLVMKAR